MIAPIDTTPTAIVAIAGANVAIELKTALPPANAALPNALKAPTAETFAALFAV
jgi:hypothetical protein